MTIDKFTTAPKNDELVSKVNEIIDNLGGSITNYVTTNTAQDISGRKTFLGEKAIYFKQTATTDKLGFTLYNPSNAELGALEWRPNTINGNALLALNCPQSGSNYVGFRYWSNINIIAPRPTTNGNYFIPVNVTDGTNTVTANNNGTLNISSLLPDISDMATQTWVTNQGYTTNVGTVTSVNNTQPDASGNVTLTIPDTATWGNITGTLSDQTDLQTALNAKQNTISDLSTIRSGASLGATALQPNDNITELVNNAGYITGITSSDVTTALGYTPYNSTNPSGYITSADLPTVDQTFDGTSANAQSGVAINGELASNYQAKLVSGTNIKTINNTSLLGSGNIAVLQNNSDVNATGALSILGNYNLYQGAISIGKDAASYGIFSVSLGEDASAGESSIAIGLNAVANTYSAIQIGEGTNSESETLSVGFRGKNGGINPVNYQLLDGSTGLIPDARISSNIARTSDIPTSISDLTDDTATYPIDKAESVVDNNSGSLTFWTGTKAEYDAIVTKDANTLYNVEDTTSPIISILDSLYPVGSIYIGTMSACPLQTLGVGTWQLVATDRVLQGAGTRGSVGDTLNERLPNIKGGFLSYTYSNGSATGAFTSFVSNPNQLTAGSTSNVNYDQFTFDASTYSSTYQNNAPVQQDAYLVNIWERIS